MSATGRLVAVAVSRLVRLLKFGRDAAAFGYYRFLSRKEWDRMALAIEVVPVGDAQAPLEEIQLRAILFKLKLDCFKRVLKIRFLALKCHKAHLGIRYLRFRIHIIRWWLAI